MESFKKRTEEGVLRGQERRLILGEGLVSWMDGGETC